MADENDGQAGAHAGRGHLLYFGATSARISAAILLPSRIVAAMSTLPQY